MQERRDDGGHTVELFALRDANEALLSLKRSEVNGTAVLMVGDS